MEHLVLFFILNSITGLSYALAITTRYNQKDRSNFFDFLNWPLTTADILPHEGIDTIYESINSWQYVLIMTIFGITPKIIFNLGIFLFFALGWMWVYFIDSIDIFLAGLKRTYDKL